MSAPPTVTRVRLAELVATLSLGTDLGMGQPMEHVMRQSLIALRLAERLGLDEAARGVVYYVGLIAWVGCHVDAYEQAKWFGDDMALKDDVHRVDMPACPRRRSCGATSAPAEGWRSARAWVCVRRRRPARRRRDDREPLARHQRAGGSARTRSGGAGKPAPDLRTLGRQGGAGRGQGRGDPPDGAAGEPRRRVEVYHRSAGVDAAIAVARERSGTQFDPALVDLFCAEAPTLLATSTR